MQEFAAELANPATDLEEQVVVLKFVLHFVGDIHQLPEPSSQGSFRLSDDYVTMATGDVATQLSKAGVRLAFILNQALKR